MQLLNVLPIWSRNSSFLHYLTHTNVLVSRVAHTQDTAYDEYNNGWPGIYITLRETKLWVNVPSSVFENVDNGVSHVDGVRAAAVCVRLCARV